MAAKRHGSYSPLGTQAPVKGIGTVVGAFTAGPVTVRESGGSGTVNYAAYKSTASATTTYYREDPNNAGYPGIYADLTAATAATINTLRTSFQIQKLLERDARGGTRYTEIVRAHFGVISPDARLQRPEYLGGGSARITINPVAQTSGTAASGTTTPMGTLSAIGTGLARGHGFTQSFTEHGMILGLCNVRADLTYQQGIHKKWTRSTRYDFYWPAFAMLGEQTVLNKELYVRGDANDNLVFGYQERWAEYRYDPSEITGYFKSTVSTPIDGWHYGQKFTSLPTLNDTFIQDGSQATVSRTTAVGAAANGQQLLLDMLYEVIKARPMPMYSVPGLIDHF